MAPKRAVKAHDKSADEPARSQTIVAGQLRALVQRIERLEEEKAALTVDIREVYAEAKAHGFDGKTLRQVVRLRKIDKTDRAEQEALLDLYLEALGER